MYSTFENITTTKSSKNFKEKYSSLKMLLLHCVTVLRRNFSAETLATQFLSRNPCDAISQQKPLRRNFSAETLATQFLSRNPCDAISQQKPLRRNFSAETLATQFLSRNPCDAINNLPTVKQNIFSRSCASKASSMCNALRRNFKNRKRNLY